jgi:hypothetical protein
VSRRWRSTFDRGDLADDPAQRGNCANAALYVGQAINEMTFEIAAIVDIGADRRQILQDLHSPEREHCPLSLSECKVAVL